jgi:membrane-bound lytic murein transglycosylase A
MPVKWVLEIIFSIRISVFRGFGLTFASAREHGPPDDREQYQQSAQGFKQNQSHDASAFSCVCQARTGRLILGALVVVLACTTRAQSATPADSDFASNPPPVILQVKSQWVPVSWSELTGLSEDSLFQAWNAWLRSCEKPMPAFARLCGEVRRMSIASNSEQLGWMMANLQPYRVEGLAGSGGGDVGLLTAYYEPVFEASRLPEGRFQIPLYRAPAGLGQRKPWYSRQDMETLPAALAALRGREIAFLADPLDALVLQIQGSGRLRLLQPDSQAVTVRLAYAGTNDHPYKSVGRWLIDRGEIRDGTWPGIKAWAEQNPQRVQEMLWSNPRVVFFREEALPASDPSLGPRGAQGVALTPGRSIAVDPGSIPYGTPVWMASQGGQITLNRLVIAQDTGGAIVGAVRADYFAGSGAEAGELAGRLKQPLRLWVLWPKAPG